ncbi:hypothetical protein Dimus_010987, partial [Dionaea muscipula]
PLPALFVWCAMGYDSNALLSVTELLNDQLVYSCFDLTVLGNANLFDNSFGAVDLICLDFVDGTQELELGESKLCIFQGSFDPFLMGHGDVVLHQPPCDLKLLISFRLVFDPGVWMWLLVPREWFPSP